MMALELFSFALDSRFLLVASVDLLELSLLVEVGYDPRYPVKYRMDPEM